MIVDSMEFSFQETSELHKIKVFGIGGGGNNAINNMINAGISGPLFIAANSDRQDLERNLAPHKIQVGTQLTRGLGCGGKPAMGKAATQEDLDRIKDALADSDMVFITAGMGGGTGSGGAPVVAEALSKLNNPPLIVGVVTKPFKHEFHTRIKQANAAIEELTKHCDCILVVPNQKLLEIMPKGTTADEAWYEADSVLIKAVRGITDLITGKGHMNVDFQDLKSVMSKRGPAIIGMGEATGDNRALKAAKEAVSSPLLDDLSIKGAMGILINVTAPREITLEEYSSICEFITSEANEEADVFQGLVYDDNLENGMVKVTVIATGLECAEKTKEAERDKAEAEAREQKAREAALEAESEAGKDAYTPPPVERFPAGLLRAERLERPATSGEARRRMAASQVADNFPLDAQNLEVPTYLRRRAD